MQSRLIVSVAAALLAGVAALPAQALDLGLGGLGVSAGSGDSGGTSISASLGDTSAGVTLGGGENIASVGAGTGGTGLNVGVGNTTGDLITTSSTGGTTALDVNLGGLGLGATSGLINGITDPLGETLDGVDLGGLLPGGGPGTGGPGAGGPGAGGGTALASAFGSLSGADQQALRIQCRSVLASPGSFNANVVALCRLIARL